MYALKPITRELASSAVRQSPAITVAGRSRSLWRSQVPGSRSRVNSGCSVRAVISREDKVVDSAKSVETENHNGPLLSSSSSKGAGIDVRAVITIKKKMKEKITEKIEDQWEFFINGIGQGILMQLISEEIDPVTNSGKSVESCVRGWLPRHPKQSHIVEYAADFTVPHDFGTPGAILITNLHGKEFHLLEIVVHGFNAGPIFFPADTWIHSRNDNPESRIIFTNKVYLPSQTPTGIKDLRREDLLSVRGNGKGERKPHERIYDYAPYNDLGKPDKDKELARPVLTGAEWPYPRRCRTGRPPTNNDPRSESRIEKPHPVYVPRDETFEEIKQNTFSAGRLKALLHNLVPSIIATLSSSDVPFTCFSDIDKLYKVGVLLKDEEQHGMFSNPLFGDVLKQVLSVGEKLLKYEIPAVIKRDRFAWLRDNEFARQTFSGVNPVNIELLRGFPILSSLDPAIYGSPESAITKELIGQEIHGMSVEKAIEEKRLFILDYHDTLLPFMERMNSLPGRKAYASRTVFFYTQKGFLRPIAIELSLPPTFSSLRNKSVFTHGHDPTEHWIWKLAKAHVCSNDAGIHQLVNHWLRTHACMEPYIIATHRQLSSMHPIFKLLHPHMRYTLEINALARQSLINGGGIIEACFSPGKYGMEVSSAAYKNMWRFDMEALPSDLIRRGMAVEDPSMPCGVKLVIEDYPYAADGLLIWSAIKEWVESYVEHFYSEPNSVTSDVELQAWWNEIKNKGHYDKRNEPWWPKLNTKEDLCDILTIIIWTASGQHAAINFGQYPFGGYVPNRPTLMRKLIPKEGEADYDKFILNPQLTFLSSLPTQLQATKVMAVQDTLSTHSADEEYLGEMNQLHNHWINDQEVLELFNKFSSKLKGIEDIINRRNKDTRLKNRTGAGIPPYELLLPSSGPGVTGRGIPNSISI
ncbi:lipoxygenase 6, chloroplastic-like [Tripterygium wilfordii]|uniref:lipoxygenase 6, chloroplastic n=1 Tax=Tripterygium wilfordii TaxID=458696 RepID=UPI0018F827A3|nr:lipoxygenase 6, chloroplastic [Tripterygium wilfordii]XP_038704577.1 lipoxygenase 6, chloroplastic-like [Tripterygium wilfordii]